MSSYSLSSVDGTLTKVGDYDMGGTNPAGITVTPDGKWVYLVNCGTNTVAGFSVNRATGALTAVTGSPFPGGSWELCIDHSERFLYVGAVTGLLGFAINQETGVLDALPGSPFDNGVANAGVGVGACTLTRVPK